MAQNISITNARKNLYQLAELALNKGAEVNIQTKNGNLILISEQEYRGLIETLYLSSNQALKDSIIEGKNTPLSDTIDEDDIDWS